MREKRLTNRAKAAAVAHPGLASVFLLSSLMHALGHAGLAAAGGLCIRLLTSPSIAMDVRSTTVEKIAVVGFFAVLLKTAGGIAATYSQARLASDVGRGTRLDVLDAWLGAHSVPGARQRDQGGAPKLSRAVPTGENAAGVTQLTLHIREVEEGLELGVLGGIRAVVQLIPLVVLLFWIAPSLATASVLVMIPFGVLLGGARKRWKAAHVRGMRGTEALVEAADEAIRHADVWRVYGAEQTVRAHLERVGQEIAQATARVRAFGAAMSGANELLGALAFVIVVALLRRGALGASSVDLVPFAIVFFLAYKPIREISDARLALLRAEHALTELFPAGLPASGADSPGASGRGQTATRQWALSSLEFCAVTTNHGKHPALSICIEPGEIVAISAPTGSGKTSLLRALLGLDRLSSGSIRYGERDLVEGEFGPEARPFAWVPQDAPVLADSIEHNVELIRTSPSNGSAKGALALVGAGELHHRLGDARLGAGGRAVSGGERQWISLARAIATHQPVLLLDEPTSGLDAEAEQRVLDVIERFRGERTVLMVTHRPAPLRIADRVLTLAG